MSGGDHKKLNPAHSVHIEHWTLNILLCVNAIACSEFEMCSTFVRYDHVCFTKSEQSIGISVLRMCVEMSMLLGELEQNTEFIYRLIVVIVRSSLLTMMTTIAGIGHWPLTYDFLFISAYIPIGFQTFAKRRWWISRVCGRHPTSPFVGPVKIRYWIKIRFWLLQF